MWESSPGPLQEQQVPFDTEPSLHALTWVLIGQLLKTPQLPIIGHLSFGLGSALQYLLLGSQHEGLLIQFLLQF